MTDIASLGVTALSKRIRSGQLSPVVVVKIALSLVDAMEPELWAWETIARDDALRQAAGAAKGPVTNGESLGPLHGAHVGVKDVIATGRPQDHNRDRHAEGSNAHWRAGGRTRL